ncbi:methionine--tRNA ligase [Candidatus Bipolaricaulota sp. J31]
MKPEIKRVLVCSAWPYGSGVPHLGNLVACLLSGDVFTRFYRMLGYETLHVSGTDAHGTRIEYEAHRRGISPKELVEAVHARILEIIRGFDIAIDNYTITESPVHIEFVTEIYKQMDANGYIFSREEERAYCNGCNRFLADRFIVGTCPYCGYPNALGNQCEACGRLLEPEQLCDPRCAFCGSTDIVRRKTRHWYLDLEKLAPKILEYVKSRDFRGNVKLFTERMIEAGLKPRAVTRDISWGIPAPFAGAEGKVIYVWAEAALGYVSATIEHFRRRGDADEWKKFWFGDEVWQVYTQGKDNIPFHTIFFPAQLIASGQGYHLPDQIAATEYLNWIGGESFSKTRRVGIYADEALKLLPAVYWRFYLLYHRPETADVNFSWEDFDRTINAVFVNNIANFVHRVLSFIWSRFEGRVPDVPTEGVVGEEIQRVYGHVLRTVEEGSLASALKEIAKLSVFGNEYFQHKAPWQTGDEEAVASAAHLVKALAILLEPFVPSFAGGILETMGVGTHGLADALQGTEGLELVRKPTPPLAHVDVEDLKRRYREMKEEGLVSIEEFQRLELVVGRIISVEEIPGADKLYKLSVDLGDRKAQAVAGIKKHYRREELVGKLVAVVANLKPATIRGVRSECMILAASDGTLAVLTPDREVRPGTRIR